MKLMKAARKEEEKGKTFMEKYFAGARENKEALKYVALFLSFCVAFYLVYYFLTLRGSLSLLKNLTASILGAIFFFAKLILLAMGYTLAQISAVNLSGAYLANFNLVPLIALAIVTPKLGMRRRCEMLAMGIPLLFLLHVLDLIAHFPVYFYGSGLARMVVYSIGVAGVAAPFIIWFCMIYRDLFEPLIKKRGEGERYFCPVCGAEEEKADIAKHIRDAHGKGAFRSEAVEDFFDAHPKLKRKRYKTLFLFLQKTLLLRKSLYKTFGKSFIKSASRKYASQKTCAKRKKDMAKSYLCEYKTKVLEMNRKAYIIGRRNFSHASISDRSAGGGALYYKKGNYLC